VIPQLVSSLVRIIKYIEPATLGKLAINTVVITGAGQLVKRYVSPSSGPSYFRCTSCNKYTISYKMPELCKCCGSVGDMAYIKLKNILDTLNG
jgi:hypothetical protein